MPAPVTVKTDLQLLEVFSSFQGEGLLLGRRQIFIRLADCNLQCDYCDTHHQPAANCRVEDAPGSGEFMPFGNPVSLEILYNLLHQWLEAAPGVHHSISLTGGEPLLQGEALQLWLPALAELLPVCLETNGTLPRALEPLLDDLTWIMMDVKLPSVSGVPTPWQAHCNFLDLAKRTSCLVKLVVADETETREVVGAARMVRDIAPDVPLILQPVTRRGEIAISPHRLFELQTQAARIHSETLVIPQVHRLLKVP